MTLPMQDHPSHDHNHNHDRNNKTFTHHQHQISWQEMVDGLTKNPPMEMEIEKPLSSSASGTKESEEQDKTKGSKGWMIGNPEMRLALYIAMAHGGLILSLAAIYGVGKLLQDFWSPIQWAVLCSMPLREIQSSLVDFWSEPLNLGLLETLLAVPAAIFDSMSATLDDLLNFLNFKKRRSRNKTSESSNNRGFAKMLRWLVSFGLFVGTYERLGVATWAIFMFGGLLLYAAGQTIKPSKLETSASTLKAIMQWKHIKSRRVSLDSQLPLSRRVSRFLTQLVLKRLRFLIAIALISLMVVGSLAGILLFSYKIGVEGKVAVVAIKDHVQKSNYAEKVGLKQWIDEKNIAEIMDTYTVKFYETVYNYMDEVAIQYNITDVVDSLKHYFVNPKSVNYSSSAMVVSTQTLPHPISQSLHRIYVDFKVRNFSALYGDMDALVRDIARDFHLSLSRDELRDKAKKFTLSSVEVFKRLYQSSTSVLTGGGYLVFSAGASIASGAVEIINFFSQLMVFFWLLYYLITSESGGVMDHVLSMMPISNPTRERCAEVLHHAVSSVLLATAKIAFFQAAFTWLLFKFLKIHFVYVPTMVAFTNALLPIFPIWVCAIPAGVELAVEGQYIQAVVTTVIYLWIMDYGVAAIQADVPGWDSYLTGLSIIGGMALFSPALEGAIMGPLILTFMMALKNLYCEFILPAFSDTAS